MTTITLQPLAVKDYDDFVKANQDAFNYGALEEFGMQDDHFEAPGEIIAASTIMTAIEQGEAYQIMHADQVVGGAVLHTEHNHGELDLLFINPPAHSRGFGTAAWQAIEQLHPEVTIWETVTPYFEKRNIHFYVNRLGFQIVEFFNQYHPDPNDPATADNENEGEMFRFVKRLS